MPSSKPTSYCLCSLFSPFLVMSVLSILTTPIAYATQLGADFSTDSDLTLTELAAGGDYRQRRITIATVNGRTVLTVTTDGNQVQAEMPYSDCAALWDYVIANDAEYLENVIGGALPDSSSFTLTLRVGSTSHSFRVEGVDSLLDPRYKDIVKEILRVAAMHMPGSS